MDPELLAKLLLRLRAVEGASAQMPQPASTPDVNKAVGRLNVSHFSRHASEESCHSPANSPRAPERRAKVRVPDWVVEGQSVCDSPRHRSTASWPGASTSSSHTQQTPPLENEGEDSEIARLEREFRRMRKERDVAQAHAAAAEAQTAALAAELQRQEEDCRRLVNEVEASHRAQERLQSELREAQAGLPARRAIPIPVTGFGMAPALLGTNLQMPGQASTTLSSPRSPRSHTIQEDVDLEFIYDVGLDLSGQMSIQRALHLAQNATRRRNEAQSSRPSFPDDASFDSPLEELLDALRVLQSAAEEPRSHATGEEAFSEPIAQLREAVAILSNGVEEDKRKKTQEEDFLDSMESLQEVVNLMRRDAEVEQVSSISRNTSKKQEPDLEIEDFDDSFASLQEVVELLRADAEKAGASGPQAAGSIATKKK